MVNWESQPKTPQESARQTHLLYFTYSYCILSRIWKIATSLLVLRHCEHLFNFSMLILHVTSSQFWLMLLMFAKYLITLPTHFHMHIERHTHISTHVQSAHKRNGDNQAQEPKRCKTSSVGQSAGLSILRSSVRFRQKLKKLRTQIYMDLRYIDPQARVLNHFYK